MNSLAESILEREKGHWLIWLALAVRSARCLFPRTKCCQVHGRELTDEFRKEMLVIGSADQISPELSSEINVLKQPTGFLAGAEMIRGTPGHVGMRK